MEKRSIQIDLDTARVWYKGKDKYLRILAKQTFTMEELEEPNLPKSWEEFDNGLYLSSRSLKYTNQTYTLEKLLTLRDVYRQGWKPDWKDDESEKYCIFLDTEGILVVNGVYRIRKIFSFPTQELAKQFLENFRKELEQLKELL